MKKLTTEIKVPQDKLANLENALNQPNPDFHRDDVIWEASSKFDDGVVALFQVISTNDPADEPCWSQIVLFDESGAELACSDVMQTVLGPCEFIFYDGQEYVVNVIAA